MATEIVRFMSQGCEELFQNKTFIVGRDLWVSGIRLDWYEMVIEFERSESHGSYISILQIIAFSV